MVIPNNINNPVYIISKNTYNRKLRRIKKSLYTKLLVRLQKLSQGIIDRRSITQLKNFVELKLASDVSLRKHIYGMDETFEDVSDVSMTWANNTRRYLTVDIRYFSITSSILVDLEPSFPQHLLLKMLTIQIFVGEAYFCIFFIVLCQAQFLNVHPEALVRVEITTTNVS